MTPGDLAHSLTPRPSVCLSVYLCVQVWCETNLRRCISKFHRFVCDGCDKAFPLRSALDLHKATAHPEKPGPAHSEEQGVGQNAEADQTEAKADLPAGQASFLQGLGLQHVSTVSMGSEVVSPPTPPQASLLIPFFLFHLLLTSCPTSFLPSPPPSPPLFTSSELKPPLGAATTC